jgi:transposase
VTFDGAATELQRTERQVRRLLKRVKAEGDQAVIHGLRGRASNRKLSEAVRQKVLAVLSQPEWRDFGPTLASYHLAKDYQIRVGREALRQMMMAAGLWRAKRQKVEDVHLWRPRRSCRGELVQWDTSEDSVARFGRHAEEGLYAERRWLTAQQIPSNGVSTKAS